MAKGYGRGGWASRDDYTFLSLAVILIGAAFGGWLLWYHQHAEVVRVLAALQLAKMAFIARFTDSYADLAALVAGARYETVSFSELVALLDRVGQFFRLPAAILLAVLGLLCLVWAPPSRYRRQLDLAGLVREQARFYRAAAANSGRGLRLVPLRDGDPRPADPSLYVQEWVARYALDRQGQYDAATAHGALVRQLGPVWQGPRRARPTARVMFGAFALHLADRREEAAGLLGDLAEALAADSGHGPAGPNTPLAVPSEVLATADAFLREPALMRPAELVARRHGFETTALMGLLNAARLQSGVLPPAQFNGLKLMDRNLWYALHALGFPGHGPGQNTNPNPRVEAIGARAHWEAERQADCALFRPEIGLAEGAIRAALAQHRVQQRE
jgi:intracellular multiplication protein IcmP